MTRAAIYIRVSTDDQEREGTSLDSQLVACQNKAKKLGHYVKENHIFHEVYSGLSFDRPKLNEMRQLVRNKGIDLVIAYALDRLSRDPIHFIILQEECEKQGVNLLFVTEDVDTSDMGKLISHIRGYAAKLETEKIRERTTRGRKTRMEIAGKLPTGRGIIYGYDYDKGSGQNTANSYLDVVKMMGSWVINECISLNEVCRRLMDKSIAAPKGGERWNRSSVGRILRNPAYAGKSYGNKSATINGRRKTSPKEQWILVPNAVDHVAFTWDDWSAIQRQLDKNEEMSPRNQKLHYLLRGLVYCKKDGRKYTGIPMHGNPYYKCSGRNKLVMKTPCASKSLNGKRLEELVWSEIQKVLKNPHLIIQELQKIRNDDSNIEHLEQLLALNKSQLDNIDEAETRYLRLFGIGNIPQEKLENELLRIKKKRQSIVQENTSLMERIASSRNLILDEIKLYQICELINANLQNFTFEQKRLALEALNIKVWVDDTSIAIDGTVPITEGGFASQPLSSLEARLIYQPPPQQVYRQALLLPPN